MRGFLKPLGGNPTSFQTIVDRILAGAPPVRAFAYGSGLVPLAGDGALGAINTPSFYSATNTLLEQALDSVDRDTSVQRTHILIGDGRRGSPASADAQFTRMRNTAVKWIAHGGTLVVAASMAPFQTVATDPSGCRQGPNAQRADQTCPLYAFMFVAPADVEEISSAASEVFQHIFVWPVPVLSGSALTIVQPRNTPQININPKWIALPDGQYITRVRGVGDASSNADTIRLIADTTNPGGRLASSILQGEEVKLVLRMKPLSQGAASMSWTPLNPAGGLARVIPSDTSSIPGIAFITHGAEGATSTIIADLVPTGIPRWLEEFDAKSGSDIVRTYGLSRLFSSFQFTAMQHPSPIARYTFVAN